MTPWSLGVMIVLILWATPIGPEELSLIYEKSDDDSTQRRKVKDDQNQSQKPRHSRGLEISSKVKIDHTQFLKQFSQQALALDLRHCLRTEFGQADGAMAVAAELEKNGRLVHVRIIDADKSLPKCASEILEQMSFLTLARPIESAGHTIYWHVDW